VTQALDSASRPQVDGLGKKAGAILLLAAFMGYALLGITITALVGHLSMPNEIDYAWDGSTFLWVFAVPLFTLICPPGRFSRGALLLYALATAYIDGRIGFALSVQVLGDTLSNLIIYAPIHLLCVAVFAWLSRWMFRVLGLSADSNARPPRNRRLFAAMVILILAAAFPVGYRQIAQGRDLRQGRERADADWAAHTAVLRSRDGPESGNEIGGINFTYHFDPDSGLRLGMVPMSRSARAYSDRISELLRLNGSPPWSMKSRLVKDEDLAAMLTSKEMTEVTTFPYEVTPDVVVMRRGTLNRWGINMSNDSDDSDVETSKGCGSNGSVNEPVFVGRLSKYPGSVFVRFGADSVFACTDDGWILSEAWKFDP
jgi:hypothetical protein